MRFPPGPSLGEARSCGSLQHHPMPGPSTRTQCGFQAQLVCRSELPTVPPGRAPACHGKTAPVELPSVQGRVDELFRVGGDRDRPLHQGDRAQGPAPLHPQRLTAQRCSACLRTAVRLPSESLFAFDRNHCSASVGIRSQPADARRPAALSYAMSAKGNIMSAEGYHLLRGIEQSQL